MSTYCVSWCTVAHPADHITHPTIHTQAGLKTPISKVTMSTGFITVKSRPPRLARALSLQWVTTVKNNTHTHKNSHNTIITVKNPFMGQGHKIVCEKIFGQSIQYWFQAEKRHDLLGCLKFHKLNQFMTERNLRRVKSKTVQKSSEASEEIHKAFLTRILV